MTVTIRRCVLRVRRHGGWSWGPDPDALLSAATRALPRLIAKHVSERATRRTIAAQQIAGPIRLNVVTTLAELAALAAATYAGADIGSVPSTVAAQLDRALDQALDEVLGPTVVVEERGGRAKTTPAAPPDARHPRAEDPDGLLTLLARWSRAQTILDVVTAAPSNVIASWLARIRARVTMPDQASRAEDRRVEELVVRLYQLLAPASAADRARATLIVIGAVVAAAQREDVRRDAALALATLDALAPADPDRSAAEPVQTAPRQQQRATTDDLRASRDDRGAAQRDDDRMQASPGRSSVVTAALPFLAMVPLSRCGWLAATAAVLDAADARELGCSIAAAIAYKLAQPPELGWRRRPEHRAAATALAGRDLSDGELHAGLGTLTPLVELLLAPITAELKQGHHRGAPLVLVADGDGYALVDSEGTFVLAASRDLQRVLSAARGLDEPVLVPATTATAHVLDRIECANLVFVTNAAPSRDEPWRQIPGARLWTNDGGRLDRYRRYEELLVDSAALADEILAALRARPALPRADSDALDRVATHAAALALGDLAWTLFRERETPSPILALERFATLDATVESDDERVEVRIPLGRRHSDLLAHGYLTAVTDVPWLDGRVLHIMGG